MTYKVNTLKVKYIPSLNKDLAEIEAVDIEGNPVKGSMWADFPNFQSITFGTTFEANLVAKDKNGTTYHTFYPVTKPTNKSARPNMIAVVKEKQEGIKIAQENKELGIKVSSTMRMAVDIVTSLGAYQNMTTEQSIKHWRSWLWSEWDKQDKDFPPFN